AALPIWALFMKKCYADPELKLENRYFPMPDNIVAVPVGGGSADPADIYSNNVTFEYYTPKGFARYQSGEFSGRVQPSGGSAAPQDSSAVPMQAPPTPAPAPVAPPVGQQI
ncbi:MAG: penicillin-binding protein, partial [Chlorobiales bacterium]|nr:penicillin-binding protein [Chlorobiales bacterium]